MIYNGYYYFYNYYHLSYFQVIRLNYRFFQPNSTRHGIHFA